MNRTALPANPRPLTGTFGVAAAAPPRAVIYLRVSTQAQAEDGTSLDTQRADCLTQARRINAQVVGVFSDEGAAGGSYQTREGLQAALREIEAGRANRLVAFKLDRTVRDLSIILDIYKRVIQAGGVLVLSDGMTFADNPNDRLMLTVLGGVAEQREQQQPADNDRERTQVEAALSELTKRERATVEAQITGIAAGMNPAVYAQAFADMAAERERLNRRLADLGTAVEAKQSRAELTTAEKHGLLSRLIRRITVAEDGDTLQIETHGSGGTGGNVNVGIIWIQSAVGYVDYIFTPRTRVN